MTNGSQATLSGGLDVVAVWRLDGLARVVRPCPFWTRWSGQDYAAYRDFGWMDAVHRGRIPSSPATWQALLEDGKPRDIPCEVRCADGSRRPIFARLVPLTGEDVEKGAAEWVLTAVDASESARRAANQQSEVRHLVSMVSHDLRGPLAAAIMGTQALLRSPGFPDSCKGRTQGIERSVRRAVRLLSDLVDYAQTRLGHGIPVIFKPASVHEILRRVVEHARGANPECQILLEVGGDGRGSWDSERLTQVFDTLLAEAIARSDAKGPVRVVSEGGERVRVHLESAGELVSESAAYALFGQASTDAQTAIGRGKGAALGLFLVGPIVQAHAGTVTAMPTSDGRSTRFEVELPREPGILPQG